MKLKTVGCCLVLALAASTLQGCTTVVVAGAAATAGYLAHEKGYRVRDPITKTKED
jgi:hypothetical protein